MTEPEYMVTILYGHKSLQPIHYWVTQKKIKRWYGFKREYYVSCEYSQMGVWDTYAEAYDQMTYMKIITNGI